LSSLYHENQGKPAPEGQTILDSNEARDDEVAVALLVVKIEKHPFVVCLPRKPGLASTRRANHFGF